MQRTGLPPNKTATYVLRRWKTVYVSVPKAACTSLKWLVADLQEEDPQHFYETPSAETSRSMTIHHRSRWQRTPMLNELDDEELAEISPENGWFVFAVVRHPAARLWSGWQSKFLLHEPHFSKHFPEATWPRFPTSTSDVVEDFHTFVRSLAADPTAAIFHDRHFRSQSRLLRTDRVPYTRVYQTAEFGELMRDLAAHLEPLGLERMPALRRSNETPLAPIEQLFTPEVVDVVGRHYAADFEQFGYPDVIPKGLSASEYSAAELAEVGRLAERGERIGDLYRLLLESQSRQRKVIRELRTRLRARPPAVPAPRSTLQRARGRAGRIVRRALPGVSGG
jgi:Sulfotransferase family